MKAKLIKVEDEIGRFYVLESKENLPENYTLSKENCDEIFGVVDINKWANEKVDNRFNETDGYHKFVYVDGIVDGYNKAMELNKDKVFTEQDITNAMNRVWDWCEDEKDKDCSVMDELIEKHIQSLQQPTEIEVAVKMERIPDGLDESCHIQYAKVPKLDSNGNLILKKL
jgi:hypothetical protein